MPQRARRRGGKAMSRDQRQNAAADWVRDAFGPHTMLALDERAARVLEETVELAQALFVPKAIATKIVDYVYGRPVGNPIQEAGGVGLTLLVVCEAMGVSADIAEHNELMRVLQKPLEHFRARHAAKHAAGITPGIRSAEARCPSCGARE